MSVVMIIDDSEADQFLTKMLIEEFNAGIEILQAYDGREGLDILDSLDKQPDIIFLDINMPGMNGFEFLDEYSKREYKGMVIAMLTSSAEESDMKASKSYECVKAYYVKPLEEMALDVLKEL